MRTDVVVMGGGPSGMMAAVTAAGRGRSVILLEPQDYCGRKLRITGKGRCNVTNNCEVQQFMKNVPTNSKFLYRALTDFPPSATIAFFEEHGVPLKTERGNRVFPQSDISHDIAHAMEREMKRTGVRIMKKQAKSIQMEQGCVTGVTIESGVISCESAVICTGGCSYPLTGSTGDGHRFAKSAGHTITPLYPSLVPLTSDAEYCAEMQGFSLRNVEMSVIDEQGKIVFTDFGEMMFTHFGVTGPLILSASAHLRNFEENHYRLSIDLKPALDEQKLDARILRDFEKYRNREFANALDDLAGHSMIPVLVRLSGIPENTKVHSITREQRRNLVYLFKHFPVPITGTRPIDEAIVTSGGVDVREINPRTMESKLIQGLYFAGEVMNVDAYTGGYNLQIAWATGHLAGMNA